MPNEDSTPLGGPQATDSPVSPLTKKWRNLSSRELRTNSIVFPAINQAKLQTYVTLLENHGIQASDILSIQVSTVGQCRITFVSKSFAEAICENGFVANGIHILPNLVAGNQTLQLHIQDVPVWISDGAVEAALAQYGTVQCPIRHGKVKVRENV